MEKKKSIYFQSPVRGKKAEKPDFMQQFCNWQLNKKDKIYQAAVHTGKTAAFLLFRCFPYPASSEPLYFQGIRKI